MKRNVRPRYCGINIPSIKISPFSIVKFGLNHFPVTFFTFDSTSTQYIKISDLAIEKVWEVIIVVE
jgi:hypothetical protein